MDNRVKVTSAEAPLYEKAQRFTLTEKMQEEITKEQDELEKFIKTNETRLAQLEKEMKSSKITAEKEHQIEQKMNRAARVAAICIFTPLMASVALSSFIAVPIIAVAAWGVAGMVIAMGSTYLAQKDIEKSMDGIGDSVNKGEKQVGEGKVR